MTKQTLFYQFYIAIEKCFSLGVDKHSYKKSGEIKIKIFSYEDRRSIVKITNQLCKWIEYNYPDIKFIKDIKEIHIKEFLADKSKICTENTIKKYKYCIRKLQKMVRQEMYLNVTYISEDMHLEIKNKTLRNIQLEPEHIDIILKECELSRSKSVLGIKFAILFGLRVSEICKLQGRDIRIDEKILHIHDSKGKRCRNIKIANKEQLDLCIKTKEVIGDRERICPLREDSVNDVIRRMLSKNNIIIYKEHKTGIHAIRKSYAKNNYCINLEKSKSEKLAWEETSRNLGHSSARTTLKNVYVK